VCLKVKLLAIARGIMCFEPGTLKPGTDAFVLPDYLRAPPFPGSNLPPHDSAILLLPSLFALPDMKRL
jgi:hypothetical protein